LHSIVTSEVRKVVPYNQEDVSKQLVNMTGMLFGLDNDQQSDILLAQLSQVCYSSKVAQFFALLRIRDPGSRVRIFSIPDPGSASKNLSN
jgi:hypothetical protein